MPWYRGTATLYRAHRNLDKCCVGYTLHFVDEGVDTGDIIHQEVVNISALDSEPTILDRCEVSAARAIVRLVDEFERDGALPRKRQDPAVGRTYRGFPTAREWCDLADLMQAESWRLMCADRFSG